MTFFPRPCLGHVSGRLLLWSFLGMAAVAAPVWAADGTAAASQTTAAPAALVADQTVAIDKANSHITIAVKSTIDSFIGTLADYVPSITVESGSGKVTRAKLAFQFTDVKTGNDDRDKVMHDWQQTGKFPTGSFVLDHIGAAPDGRLTAVGAFSFHGVTQSLTMPVTIQWAGRVLPVDGEAVIDTRLHQLPIIRKLLVLTVDPMVKVSFHLVGSVGQ